MRLTFLMALYGGPDQLMPLTSGLTAVLAFLLIFKNKVLISLGKVWDFFRSRGNSPRNSTPIRDAQAAAKRDPEPPQ